ncbi:MAG: PEP-CTERM sorting domain-containing protein [Phycisphaerae bacterium]
MILRSALGAAVLAAMVVSLPLTARAGIIQTFPPPFSDDFNQESDGQADPAWTNLHNSTWTVQSGQLVCGNPTNNPAAPATATITNLAAGDFVMDYDVTSGDGGMFFRAQPYDSYYIFVLRPGDAYFQIHDANAWNGQYGTVAVGDTSGPRHVHLEGVGFTFTATISQPGQPDVVTSFTDPNALYDKGGFGFYSNSAGLSFDNVNTSPEPASLALLGLGALGLVARRRATR